MKYNISNEKEAYLIDFKFINEKEYEPFWVIAQNGIYNRCTTSIEERKRYIREKHLVVLAHFELRYYDSSRVEKEFYIMEERTLKQIATVVYKKTKEPWIHPLEKGHKYLLENEIEILYLGMVEERHYFIEFSEYLDRMENGRKGYIMDDPRRLRKYTVKSLLRMPTIIAHLGAYWNPRCFRIVNKKLQEG